MSQLTAYESGREFLQKLNEEFLEIEINKFNEADTRFRFIDRILTSCLGWDNDDIHNEDSHEGQYADYKLSLFRPVAVWEAKKTGNYFELPVGTKSILVNLKTICKDNPNTKKALIQVSSYCHQRGIKIGVVTNGWQIIAFIANRDDSIAPLDGDALVVNSLDAFIDNYKEVWNCLSKVGVQEEYLIGKLSGRNNQDLPPKMSASIHGYPGIKNRNAFQTDLEIISDLVLEDVVKDKSLEKDFLTECYCQTGALSQFSLVSKQILSSRYAHLFEQNDKKALLENVTNKKGISPELIELFSNSLSKRPILLIGDVGVGKSTFIDNLLIVEAPTILNRAITFRVDLGSKAIITLDVRKSIIQIIKQQLIDIYKIDINDDDFVRHAYYIELENFKKSVNVKRLYDINVEKAIEKEIEYLSVLVNDEINHIKKSLEHICKSQGKQIVIFIDNCDQRNDADQETAFLIAQEFASDWPVLVFLCLRPETFHRTKQKEGALSGYHTKAFTIPPPRIDEVIIKRLSFAQKITKGEIALSSLPIRASFSKLDLLIESLKHSLQSNRKLFTFFDNLSNGNIRKAIELIKKFFGSGHVDTEKIVNIVQEQGRYLVPVHEILRSVIFGDNVYYNPASSEITNLFDIRHNNKKDYFTISLILGLLNDQSNNNRNEGFISVSDVYAYMQNYGYTPQTIDSALNFMYSRDLFETSEKGNSLKTDKESLMIRTTSSGVYHITHLVSSFTYIDAIIVDIPIFEKAVRDEMKNSLEIQSRLDRANIFVKYIDLIWEEMNLNSPHFNWESTSRDLKSDIASIRSKVDRQKELD